MKHLSFLLTLIILGCAGIAVSDSTPITVEIKKGTEGSEIWTGVVLNDKTNTTTRWSRTTESKFQIDVPDTQSTVTIVLLKKNAVPILKLVTPELITDGLTVEYSKGTTITGNVAAMKDRTPITDGIVVLRFDEELGVQLPEEVSIFSWPIRADGTFAVHGVPLGDHTLEVRSAGHLLAEKLVTVSQHDQPPEVEIFMEQGYFISGRIIKFNTTMHPEIVYRGEIDVEPASSDYKTEEVGIEFDEDDHFKIGPFAKDAVVKLQAWVPDGRRSRKIKVVAPAEDVELVPHHWVRVAGTVRDRQTGEPVEKYTVAAYVNHVHRSEIDDPSGKFSVKMGEHAHDLNIEAPGYLPWTTVELSKNFRDGADYDLGTIELVRAHSVKGRVVCRATGEPIAGASVNRSDRGGTELDSSLKAEWMHTYNINFVRTKTDSNGIFELADFPLKGGKITVRASRFQISLNQNVDDANTFQEIELVPYVSISGQVVSLEGEPVAARITSRSATLAQTEDGTFHTETFVGKQRIWAISDSGRSQVVELKPVAGEAVEGIRFVIDKVARVRGNISGLWPDETVTVFADDVGDRTKSNGQYEIVGLSEGVHEIRARTSFGRVLTGSVSIGTNLEDRLDFEFPSSASLSGRVMAGSEGFGEYQIIALPNDERFPVRTEMIESDGTYRFEDMVPGTYKIEIPSRAFTQRVAIVDDTTVDFDVGASELAGMVRSTRSLNSMYVLVEGNVDFRKISAWTQISDDGSYRVRGLPPGLYFVQVTHPEFQNRSRPVNLKSKTVVFDIELD